MGSGSTLLHCNMSAYTLSLQNALEELLGDLGFARKSEDLGQLALLAYCEVRRWARDAGEQELARRSSELISRSHQASRAESLMLMDGLIPALEQARFRLAVAAPERFAQTPA